MWREREPVDIKREKERWRERKRELDGERKKGGRRDRKSWKEK